MKIHYEILIILSFTTKKVKVLNRCFFNGLYLHLSILFTTFSLFSQQKINGEYNFRNYSVESGLASSETYDIVQDNNKNIWIATDRGVTKYDGQKFKTYTKKDGLINDLVLQIYKDYFHRLWFLTIENDLCYLENGKIKKYKYNYLIKKHVPTSTHADKDIYIQKNNTLVYSIRNFGILKIDKDGNVSKIKTVNNELQFTEFENHYLWLYSHNYKTENTNNTNVFFVSNSKKKLITQSIIIEKIAITGDDKIGFFLLKNNIYSNKTKKIVLPYSNSIVIKIKTVKNELWVGNLKKGIQKYIVKNGKPVLIESLLDNYSVTGFLIDKEGGYWFTTLESGLFYAPYTSIKGYSKNNGLIENEIKTLYNFKNNTYIGYVGSNYQIIKKNNVINYINNSNIYPTFGSIGDKVIVSNGKGNFINEEIKIDGTWRKDFYSTDNRCVGIKENIIEFKKNGTIKTLSLIDFEEIAFHNVLIDNKNDIWAGNAKGLFKLKNKKLHPYRHKEFSFRVIDLLYNKNWGILIATRDGGLFILKNEKFIKINNLLSDDITSLAIDHKKRIWAGTNKGVNIITKNKNGELKTECITKNYGLFSNEINSICIDTKFAWIGTKKGLSKINISQFKQKNDRNIIKLNSIILNNKTKLNLKNQIKIPYDKDIISIRFGTINFISKGKYRYRLHSNSSWTIINEPKITLLNPEDGFYDLEVSFLNENNKWSENEKLTSFEVKPPFWKTIYFKILILLVVFYSIFLFFRYKKRQFETKQKLLILEQKALFAQMNPHFIFNTLNSIQSFLIYNENDKAEYFLSKFSKLLRETLHISRNSSVLLEKEIDILKKYLELEQMRFSNKFQWEILFHSPENQFNIRIPNMLIQPYIENSIKHGFTGKRTDFKIEIIFTRIDESTLKCEVIDNGIGRVASQLNKKDDIKLKDHISYGEKITKERLKSYNKKGKNQFGSTHFDLKEIEVIKGTKVEILIPIISI